MYNMKLILLAEEVLDELHGISLDARVWGPVLRNAIKLSKALLRIFSQSPFTLGCNVLKANSLLAKVLCLLIIFNFSSLSK